ncbi:hypothetical protein J6590_053303 [Homalodisca vitripennis]|nr:hypothetical protein J6590_053303 [Homalodisca vitripennis]
MVGGEDEELGLEACDEHGKTTLHTALRHSFKKRTVAPANEYNCIHCSGIASRAGAVNWRHPPVKSGRRVTSRWIIKRPEQTCITYMSRLHKNQDALSLSLSPSHDRCATPPRPSISYWLQEVYTYTDRSRLVIRVPGVYVVVSPGHDTSGERRASSGTRASPERRGEDLVHLLLLSENSILKWRVVRGCKRGIKRWRVHPINRRRRIYGEYHHLIKQLKEIQNGLAVPSTLSGAAHCRSPLKSIVTPLITFPRQHMGPDCKAVPL